MLDQARGRTKVVRLSLGKVGFGLVGGSVLCTEQRMEPRGMLAVISVGGRGNEESKPGEKGGRRCQEKGNRNVDLGWREKRAGD